MWPQSIFGYDFFISYRRGIHTTKYALQLFEELRKRNYRCFVDRQEFEAGPDFEKRLIRAVRASSYLLLLVTPQAAESRYIRIEVGAALRKKRRIIPISVEGAYSPADWSDLVSLDPSWIDEREEHLVAGKPSSEVLDDIERGYKKPRLNSVRQRLLVLTMALLSVLFGLSVYFWFQARRQATIALSRQLAAQGQLAATEHPALVERAALLGIESLYRNPSFDGDITVRNSIRLLPTLTHETGYAEHLFRTVVTSADGKFLAMSAREKLTLLDGLSGAELAHFSHKKEIFALHFSSDGNFLATASEDGTAKIISVREQKQVSEFHHAQDTDVRTAIFSPDNKVLATASTDRTAIVWDLVTQKPLVKFSHPDEVEDAQFSPDSLFIATGSQDQIARIWDLHRQRLIKSVKFGSERGMIARTIRSQTVSFSSDGKWFAASGLNGSVRILETATWREIHHLRHDGPISDLRFTPDSRYLLTVPIGKVVVWDVRSGQQIAELKHDGNVWGLAFDRGGTFLATASQDQTARVWDTTSWNEMFRTCSRRPVSGIAFLTDSIIITASDTIRFWDLTAGKQKWLLHDADVLGIAFNRDGTLLASASRGLPIWDMLNWRSHSIAPGLFARAVAFSPDGQIIAAGTARGEIAGFAINSSQRLFFHKSHTNPVNSIVFSPDGHLLLSAGADNLVTAWDVITNREVWRYAAEKTQTSGDNQVQCIRFSPDSRWLAVALGLPSFMVPGKVTIIDWKTRQSVITFNTATVPSGLAWSPDGSFLAFSDVSIHILRTGKWKQEIVSFGNQEGIFDVTFSPSGKLIASAGIDGTVRLWSTSQWSEVSRLRLPSPAFAIVFTPDERRFAAAFGHMAQIGLVNSEDLIQEACSHVTRSLTASEWKQYLNDEPRRPICRAVKR